MKETIIKFEKGPKLKKYTAYVKNKKTKKVRKIHFGHKDYTQYKDRTPLKLYAKRNNNNRKRLNRYDKFNSTFYSKVQKGYFKIFSKRKNYMIIDSNLPINVNKKIIINKILDLIN